VKIEPTAMKIGESYRIILRSRDGMSLVVYDFVEFMGFGWWDVSGDRIVEFAIVRSYENPKPHTLDLWRIESVRTYTTKPGKRKRV